MTRDERRRARYDPNAKIRNDGRQNYREALSPRPGTVPRLASGRAGTDAGRPTDNRASDPTAGRRGDTSRRRPRQYMARPGKQASLHPYQPEEIARDAIAEGRTTASNGTRPARHVPGIGRTSRPQMGTDAVAEGLRQRAMARHSILTVNGAIDVVRGTGPVWSEPSPSD